MPRPVRAFALATLCFSLAAPAAPALEVDDFVGLLLDTLALDEVEPTAPVDAHADGSDIVFASAEFLAGEIPPWARGLDLLPCELQLCLALPDGIRFEGVTGDAETGFAIERIWVPSVRLSMLEVAIDIEGMTISPGWLDPLDPKGDGSFVDGLMFRFAQRHIGEAELPAGVSSQDVTVDRVAIRFEEVETSLQTALEFGPVEQAVTIEDGGAVYDETFIIDGIRFGPHLVALIETMLSPYDSRPMDVLSALSRAEIRFRWLPEEERFELAPVELAFGDLGTLRGTAHFAGYTPELHLELTTALETMDFGAGGEHPAERIRISSLELRLDSPALLDLFGMSAKQAVAFAADIGADALADYAMGRGGLHVAFDPEQPLPIGALAGIFEAADQLRFTLLGR